MRPRSFISGNICFEFLVQCLCSTRWKTQGSVASNKNWDQLQIICTYKRYNSQFGIFLIKETVSRKKNIKSVSASSEIRQFTMSGRRESTVFLHRSLKRQRHKIFTSTLFHKFTSSSGSRPFELFWKISQEMFRFFSGVNITFRNFVFELTPRNYKNKMLGGFYYRSDIKYWSSFNL
jgi:hypothetical protein